MLLIDEFPTEMSYVTYSNLAKTPNAKERSKHTLIYKFIIEEDVIEFSGYMIPSFSIASVQITRTGIKYKWEKIDTFFPGSGEYAKAILDYLKYEWPNVAGSRGFRIHHDKLHMY